MEWDDTSDEEDENALPGPVLPTEDRLWRHPSEVAAASRVSATTIRTPWTKTLTVAGVSALLGGVVVAGAFLFLGGGRTASSVADAREDVAAQRFIPSITRVSEGGWPSMVSKRAAPGVAAIEARSGGSTRRGSAFLYRPNGLLLTSADLIGDAEQIEVTFRGQAARTGTVVGSDRRSGIAVVQVDTDTLPDPTRLALPKTPPTLGAYTLVLDGATPVPEIPISAVTALSTEYALDDRPDLCGLLQLDSRPTDSSPGAPVVDDAGDVIGMVVDTDRDGETYVIPIAYARAAAYELVKYGRVLHTWLGIKGNSLGASEASDSGLEGGVRLMEIRADGPAERGGLHPEDVVVGIDDHAVLSWCDLVLALRQHPANDTVTVSFIRDGFARETRVVLRVEPTG